MVLNRNHALAAGAAVSIWLAPATGIAQQMQSLPPLTQAPPAAKGKSGTAPPSAAKSTGKTEGAASGSDSGLRQRVEQLEEQLVDMQVVMGTLESLAKSGGSASGGVAPSYRPSPQPSGGAYSSSDAARVDVLETQIRALTAQLEQLADQVRALSEGRRSGGLSAPTMQSQASAASPQTAPRFGSNSSLQSPANTDQIGSILAGQEPQRQQQGSALPPIGGDVTSKQVYDTAYNFMLQQDYGAAETAFEDFLKRFPSDPLSANAQYWLGESHFVRGRYKPAAEAFLKGYQAYGRSAKAPDSLLKLAMSLERLGQKDAACSSYAELNSRFPNAPSHIKTRAQTERQRIGCA